MGAFENSDAESAYRLRSHDGDAPSCGGCTSTNTAVSGKSNTTGRYSGGQSSGPQGGDAKTNGATNRRPKRRSRRHCCCFALLFAVIFAAILSCWNFHYEIKQTVTPLDSLLTMLKIPLTRCPVIPSAVGPQSSSVSPSNITVYMLTGRPPSQVKEVVDSWTRAGFHVEPVSTAHMDVSDGNGCLASTWDTRLFSLYQQFFAHLLKQEPLTTHFLTIEDDTVLEDANGLLSEWEWAKETKNLDYYSFYPTPYGCAYLYGAQAQIISRKMMERTIHVNPRTFCRLPIDRWFSLAGSYWTTTRPLVRHIGTRYHPPTNKGEVHLPDSVALSV